MKLRGWLSPSHHLVATFTAVAVVSAGALGILSWQLIEQDRQLEVPRRRGLLEAAADSTARSMTSSLTQLEAIAARTAGASVPTGVSLVTISPAETTCDPAARLPFVPTRAAIREADPTPLAEAGVLEFREGGRDRAIAAYEVLAKHPDRAVRATALSRLAALYRKSDDLAGTLRAYDALSAMDDVSVGGMPGGLIAAVGRATSFEERDRRDELREAAAALARDLARGRWPLSASEFDYYSAQASTWTGAAIPEDPDLAVRADVADWLWQQRTGLPPRGSRFVVRPRGAGLIVWNISGDRIEAAVAGPTFLRALVTASVPAGFTATLRDFDGHVFGDVSSASEAATRVQSATLPWTLQILPAAPRVSPIDTSRRRLLFLVIGVTVAVLGAGWYFIARAHGRELRAARLQNDFVASVSHEFRSPLTSMAHISDMLAHDRLSTDAQRRQAYGILVGDTNRLRGMVEHLLDFGRFDTGTVALRLEQVEVGAAVAAIVEAAQRRVASIGYTIDFSPPADPIMAEVDGDSFSRALWNLVDNAVKYSPDCKTVWVTVAHDRERVAITVRDQGIGIPPAEQPVIFTRFVRGEESRARRIKGTGIGLALVRQIIDAHGGEIDFTSAVGEGSQFVVRLPVAGGVG